MDGEATDVYDLDTMDSTDSAALSVRLLHVERRRTLDWNLNALCAPYWRLYWNESGRCRILGAAGGGEIEPHRCYLVAPNTDFATRSAGAIDHTFVHFTVNDGTIGRAPGVYVPDVDEIVPPLVRRLHSILGGGAAGDTAASPHRSRLNASATALVFVAYAALPEPPQPAAASDPLIRGLVAELDRALSTPIDIVETAKRFGIGERSLRRRFVAALGQTPRAYRTTRRIDHACLLLHFSRLSIDEIAAETGFADRFHFSRVFAKLRGMGPAAFRRVSLELSRSQ